MGFSKYFAAECLLIRTTNNKGTVVVCVYIDDTLCVGNKQVIEEFEENLKQHFAIKESRM